MAENYFTELYTVDYGDKVKENYFTELYAVDFGDKVKEKNGLRYIPWAAAWAEIKKKFPDACYKIYEQPIKWLEDGRVMVTRPWFDDGKTAWVWTSVTANGIEHKEFLPVLDFKNKCIPANAITSAEANKAIQRCICKACGRHGVGLYLYEGEDIPEETRLIIELRTECYKLMQEKARLSDEAKAKVMEYCKSADENANGDPRLIEDVEILKDLKGKLRGIRKVMSKTKDETDTAEDSEHTEEEFKAIKKDIVSMCAKLGGTKNEKMMAELKKFAPSGNPNAIKTYAKAKECLEIIKSLE